MQKNYFIIQGLLYFHHLVLGVLILFILVFFFFCSLATISFQSLRPLIESDLKKKLYSNLSYLHTTLKKNYSIVRILKKQGGTIFVGVVSFFSVQTLKVLPNFDQGPR